MSNARILLVEDSPADQKIVVAALGKKFTVAVAGSVAEARRELARAQFDLILLDVELPDGNGFRFFSDLRCEEATKDIAVFFLTMKSDAPDEVMGFVLGADDYIAKPADPLKLRARVEARLRKLEERREEEAVFSSGALKLDFAVQRAFRTSGEGDCALELTPHEFKLLAFFLRHEDHVLSRDQLIERVWGTGTNVIDRTVDMHVSNLRKKLSGSGFTVAAVRGVGYRFTRETSA
jgi:DNA-binding response OmpR family regulator